MNKNAALDTLLLPFENTTLEWRDNSAFFNAQSHSALPETIECVQWFKPYSQALEERSLKTQTTLPDAQGHYDLILINLPKNRIESEYLIARALLSLKDGGQIVAAADNKAGGGRIEKTFKTFGLKDTASLSKNKARVVWGTFTQTDSQNSDFGINTSEIVPSSQRKSGICLQTLKTNNILDVASCEADEVRKIKEALKKGAPCIVGGVHTHPGIYGWDKIDKGSNTLTHHIPQDLKGHGADFGCGYGYLALHALENCPKIKSLTCIDADHRALECAKLNLNKDRDFGSKTSEIVPSKCEASEARKTREAAKPNGNKAKYSWLDLTSPSTLKNLDFIIMNPPFHEGKMTDTSIGTSFIKTAYAALRKHGVLYMVANVQLPYENILNDTFFKVEKLYEGGGFKVYKATR